MPYSLAPKSVYVDHLRAIDGRRRARSRQLRTASILVLLVEPNHTAWVVVRLRIRVHAARIGGSRPGAGAAVAVRLRLRGDRGTVGALLDDHWKELW